MSQKWNKPQHMSSMIQTPIKYEVVDHIIITQLTIWTSERPPQISDNKVWAVSDQDEKI